MKRFSRLKSVSVLVILLLLTSTLYASLVTLEWNWNAADENITHFRYRLNDQDWVVADASVTQFILEGVDETAAYQFEIQQTYDGEFYSESAYYPYNIPITVDQSMAGTAVASVPSQDPVTEEPIVMSEPNSETTVISSAPGTDMIVMSDSEPFVMEEAVPDDMMVMEGTPVVEAVILGDDEVPAQSVTPEVTRLTPPDENDRLIESLDSDPKMGIELFVGTGGKGDNVFLSSFFDPSGNFTPMRTMILPSFTFEFIYPEIVTYSPDDYLSARGGIGFNSYQEAASGQVRVAPDLRAGVSYTHRFNEKWSADALLGLSVMFFANDISADSTASIFYGPHIAVTGRYDINEFFSIAAQAETRFLMSNLFTPYELTGIVRVGVTYRF